MSTYKVGDTFYGRTGNVNFLATVKRISRGTVAFDYYYEGKDGSKLANYVCDISSIQFYVNEYKLSNSPLGQALK